MQRIIFAILSLFFLYVYSIVGPDVHPYSLVGIFLFLNIGFDFFIQLGKTIPIKQLILLIALIQWVIAPFLSYHYYSESQFYYMQVPEEQYMSYNVPAVSFFVLGLFIPLYHRGRMFYLEKVELYDIYSNHMVRRGRFLFWIGILSLMVLPFVPGNLGFAFFLLSKLTFIGAFYLYAAKVRFRMMYLVAAYLPVIYAAINSSIFHDLFLWGGFLFIVYALLKQIGLIRKALIILSGIGLVLFIQLIKQEYRAAIVEQTEANTEVLTNVAAQKLSSNIEEESYFQDLVDRLNQGWIIARIMYVVPSFEPFAEGETIETGLKAAFIPRIFNPEKVESGGAYFERFTGMELINTSMNLGLIGEAYANYGVNGGMFFMFLFGLFVNIVLTIILAKSNVFPELLLWIPFLFLYMIKAEDDFTTMINQFTKALYVLFGMFWVMSKLYPNETLVYNDSES